MEQAPQQPASPAEIPEGTSLVVICREERTVRSTVAFLNRRGVPTKIVTNMNDAVDMFTKKQANMALLSVNYPHPKIEVIPSLLKGSFQVDCIVFAEDTDRKSTQRLSSTKARHALFGPVSGPVVLMRVRQIEKENTASTDEAAASANGESVSDKSDEDSGAIKVGGGKGNQGDRINVKSKSKGDGDDAANMMKALGEDDEAVQIARSEGLERSGGTIVQKGSRSSMKRSTQSGPLDKARRGELAARSFGRALDRGLTEAPPNGRKPKLLIPPPPWTTPEKEAELEAREEAELAAEIEAEQAAEAQREKAKEAREFEEAKETAATEAKAKARAKAEAKEASTRKAAEQAAEREKKASELAVEKERRAAEAKESNERAARERVQKREEIAKAEVEQAKQAAEEKEAEEKEIREKELKAFHANNAAKDAKDTEAKKAKDAAAAATAAKPPPAVGQMSPSEKPSVQQSSPDEATAPKEHEAAKAKAEKDSQVDPAAGGVTELRPAKSPQEDFFLRCLREAVTTVCGVNFGAVHGLSKMRAAGLVSVKSPRIEGSFVIQIGRSRLNPEAFLQRIEVAFFSVIRNAGIELGQGEQFAIELEDFGAVTDAFAASDYIVVSSSVDHEVAIAVIPTTNPNPKLESHKDNMLKVSVADLPVDIPLTFDVFLHLPSNKKYLRYLKVGGKMSGKQSNRLSQYKIGHLFLSERDKDAYRKHYAARSIDPKKRSDQKAS